MRIEIENLVKNEEPTRRLRLVQEGEEVQVETTDDDGNKWTLIGFRANDDGLLTFFRAANVGDTAVDTDDNRNIEEVDE